MEIKPSQPSRPLFGSKPEVAAALRFFAVLIPQSAASAIAAAWFVHESGFASFRWMRLVVWIHLGGVIALQALLLLGWGRVARGAWAARSRVPARLFACAAFCAAAALNLCYVAQALSLHVWSSPLTPSIRSTLWPQLRYSVETVGFGPSVILGGVVLLLVAGVGLACWQARRIWALLLWATPSESLWAHHRRGLTWGVGGLLAAAVAGTYGTFGADAVKAFRSDLVLSPWIGFDAPPDSQPGDLSADNAARQNYPAVAHFHRRNVIVIIIDCLRADHLPMFGYPRDTAPYFAELAAAGRLQSVDRAFSVSNASKNGILGILGSRYPEGMHIGNFNLPEVLKRQGYRTHIIASGDHTVFQSLRAYYGDHIDFYVDGLSAGHFTVNDDRNVLATVAQLPASDGTPEFFYLHLMSVHPVGVRRPESLRWPSDKKEWTAYPGAGLLFRQAAIDAYDDGILQANLYLRRIFADLGAKGYLRDYVAVITGDHGESFGEHGASGHGRSLWQSEVGVPILFMESGNFHYGRMPFASQVDIAPTLLDRLNLPVPSCWQGRSLLASPSETQAYLTENAPGPWRGLVWERAGHPDKYLFDAHDPGHFQEKLFDLARDPAEDRDLAGATPPDALAEFRRAASSHFKLPLPP